MEELEIYKRNQMRLISSLIKLNRKMKRIELKAILYSKFLTSEQQRVVDDYIAELAKEGDE